MFSKSRAALSGLMCVLLAGVAVAAWSAQEAPTAQEQEPAKQESSNRTVVVPFFGNTKCPLTGNEVDRMAFVTHDNQRVYVCCKNCQKKGREDAAGLFAKAYGERQKLKAEQCPISGRPVVADSAKTVQYQGYEVDLCCGGCVKKFHAHPYSTLTRLMYPDAQWVKNETCPVMDDEKSDAEVLAVYDNHVVSFCCEMCVDDFIDAPEEVLAKAKG